MMPELLLMLLKLSLILHNICSHHLYNNNILFGYVLFIQTIYFLICIVL